MSAPNYKIPSGMTVTSQGTQCQIYPNASGSYDVVSDRRGLEVMTYKQVLSVLKRPDAWSQNRVIQGVDATARVRSGGLFYVEQLCKEQQQEVEFREALCVSLLQLQKDGAKLTQPYLNRTETRQVIRAIAGQIYTKHPIDIARRGGGIVAACIMPKGRTLLNYLKRYVESAYDPMALADHKWLQGNRHRRISSTVLEMILRSIEEIDMDPRKRSVRGVYNRFKTLLASENASRALNGLEPLEGVCYSTIREEVRKISPTARAIARNGLKSTLNTHSRGSTDSRALMIGDCCDIDECKISLMSVSKKNGWFSKLSAQQKVTLKEVDEIIHSRLSLVVIIDVASRMPLGWTLSETPGAEATRSAMRMAMRNKTKEKIKYGCTMDPMPAVGINLLRNDNGSGLRNTDVKSAAVGLNMQALDARTYRGGDKPYVERMFGTMESQLFAFLHGYTGRRAGALPGYDPIKNGVLNTEELYALITRYLVDEYPLRKHTGTTMFGRRPIEVAKDVAENAGEILPPTAHDLRIHLGFEVRCKITHEGVKAFGLPFNSVELQAAGEIHRGKVKVFVNPDDISFATVLIEGRSAPIAAELSWTAVQDLTLPEFFEAAELARKSDPQLTQEFESTLNSVVRERFDHMERIASEKKLPRSYITIAEAERKASEILRGVHSARTIPHEGSATPGSLNELSMQDGAYKIAGGFENPLEHQAEPQHDELFTALPDTKGKLI